MSTIKNEISCQIVNINDNYLDSIHLIDYLECSKEAQRVDLEYLQTGIRGVFFGF